MKNSKVPLLRVAVCAGGSLLSMAATVYLFSNAAVSAAGAQAAQSQAAQPQAGQAQPARPRGAGANGGSSRPTGGAAAGPGEGAQAVAADPAHGETPAQTRRPGLVAYPERPKAPQAVLDRGKATYSVNCAFCHGSDALGGSVGPNLIRSEVVLQDQKGELIMPIVHGARADRGMPRIEISDAQVTDIADWLHSLRISVRGVSEKINIVVGNADTGKATFDRMCATCHSTTGDLKGFSAKFSDPRAMQQAWILPGGAGRGGPAGGGAPVQLNVPPITATVTMANGSKVTGKLGQIDDFYVELTTDDGAVHRYTRWNDMPKVEIHDPLAAHREMFRTYKDKDIHDITAYLVTLK